MYAHESSNILSVKPSTINIKMKHWIIYATLYGIRNIFSMIDGSRSLNSLLGFVRKLIIKSMAPIIYEKKSSNFQIWSKTSVWLIFYAESFLPNIWSLPIIYCVAISFQISLFPTVHNSGFCIYRSKKDSGLIR